MKPNNKVLLGMSGGTDSSVAAILLQEAGYEVTGVTFRFFEKDNQTEYLDDARELCRQLGIPHLTYDARTMFQERIISYFIQEYMAGHTPVPCTLCNNYLKWPLLEKLANQYDIWHFATGHYVRKVLLNGTWYIQAGTDPDKDQSFFLWGLPQSILQRMLLPMGDLSKKEVREIAASRGFQKAAHKRDSLGVCFCPMDYRSFLKAQLPEGSIQPGEFLDEHGMHLGQHEGYPYYTIGQRRGLGIYLNKALFVKQLVPEKNQVIISDRIQSLEQHEMFLKDWHIHNPNIVFKEKEDHHLIVKIRYRKQANHCTVSQTSDGLLKVQLHEPLAAIAPGQAAAFYWKDIVVGGGIII